MTLGQTLKKGEKGFLQYMEDWILGLLWSSPSILLESPNHRMLEVKGTSDNTLVFLSFTDEKLELKKLI